ncbi:MAG: elongator complex protein 3 [Huintestinicola sp.]
MSGAKHSNISVFIPHMGCPHTCSFCNQRTISASTLAPTAEETDKLLYKAYDYISSPEKRKNTEIAFFGGSFTAIDRSYMESLLRTAEKYIRRENGFCGIRISTRPDCIDEEILMLLKRYGVTAIELGAQSMSDRVLEMNERGHTAEDVKKASELIKAHGFSLGLQMMVGLYGSTEADEYHTMTEFIKIRPDTARIYPVSVLKGTRLAELYEKGDYKLYPFEKAVNICGVIYCAFVSAGINVIRMGLHAEDGISENAVAGFYHPAFGEIVRSEIVKNAVIKYYMSEADHSRPLFVEANKSLIGAVYGHKKSNKNYFSAASMDVRISENNALGSDEISINKEVRNVFKIT